MTQLTGTSADDTLTGGSGADTIEGLGGRDRLYGGGGADVLVGEFGDVVIDGGAGVDLARLDFSAATAGLRYTVGVTSQSVGGATIVGVEQVDLTGGRANDVFTGGALNDTLNGWYGNDVLKGGGGDDLIVGGEGYNVLEGNAGHDTLIGGLSTDQLTGGDGDDLLVGGVSDATIDGGAGVDRAVLEFGGVSGVNFSVAANLAGGVIVQGTRIKNVEAIDFAAGSGDDTLAGGGLADNLHGGWGQDQLTGGGGDDTLDGGLGTDTAIFSGRLADYRLEFASDGLRIADQRGGDGTDEAHGVEQFAFADGVWMLADLAHALGKTAPNAADDAATVAGYGAVGVDVLDNDFDPQFGGALTVVSVDETGLLGQAQVGGLGGSVFYTAPQALARALAPGESLTEHFTYTVADSFGLTASAGVTVTIEGVNDAPVAGADVVVIGEDGASRIAVLANDSDVDHGDQVTLVSATSGSRGSTHVEADGTVSYTPGYSAQGLNAGQSLVDHFSYTVRDQAGLTSNAEVEVIVQGANDRPIAEGEGITVSNAGVTVLTTLLDNDTDVDQGDQLSLATVQALSASGASISLDAQGHVAYDPGDLFVGLGAGQTATDSFSYEVADSHGAKSTATVTLTITGAVLPEPDLVVEAYGEEDQATDNLYQLVMDQAQFALGEPVTLVSVDASATPGTVTLQGTELIYVADDPSQDALWGDGPQHTGFLYTVSTLSGELHTGQVNLTIMGTNDTPVAVGDGLAIDEGASSGNLWDLLMANDSDLDAGQHLGIEGLDLAGTQGRVTFNADTHSLVYHADTAVIAALDPGQTLVDHFSYTLTDEWGATSTAVVTVTVAGAAAETVGDAGWMLM